MQIPHFQAKQYCLFVEVIPSLPIVIGPKLGFYLQEQPNLLKNLRLQFDSNADLDPDPESYSTHL